MGLGHSQLACFLSVCLLSTQTQTSPLCFFLLCACSDPTALCLDSPPAQLPAGVILIVPILGGFFLHQRSCPCFRSLLSSIPVALDPMGRISPRAVFCLRLWDLHAQVLQMPPSSESAENNNPEGGASPAHSTFNGRLTELLYEACPNG